jgi:WhiB family redox-sensing transcriptional regulator
MTGSAWGLGSGAALDWRVDGACRQVDPELMFPTSRADERAAVAVCVGCPALEACRRWALDPRRPERHGVWGGLTEQQRADVLGTKRRRCTVCHIKFTPDPRQPRQHRCAGCARQTRQHVAMRAARAKAVA